MNNTVLSLCFYFFLFGCCVTVSNASLFYVNGTLYKEVNTPSLRIGDSFNFTAKVVLGDPETACSKLQNPDSDLFGNILWISPTTGAYACDLADTIRKVEKRGAIGVIYGNSGYGGGHGILTYFNAYNMEHEKSSIPAVELYWQDHKDLRDLIKDKSNIVTVVLWDGKNDMKEAAPAWISYSVILGLFTVLCITIAIYKWRLFVMHTGFQVNVPQACLLLNVISAVFRLLIVVDPPYTRGIYPYQFTAILDILSYPIVLVATLLMSFYWEEAMRVAKVHSMPTLQKMKIPFSISAFVLMFLACLCVIMRSLNSFLNLVTIINICIILFFTVPITIFYSVSAGKILRILFRSKKVNLGRKQTALYKMTLFLVSCAASMISYVLVIIFFIALPYNTTRYITIRWILHALVNFVCLFQALAFQNPKGMGQTTNSSEQKHNSGGPTLPTQNTADLSILEMSSTKTESATETA